MFKKATMNKVVKQFKQDTGRIKRVPMTVRKMNTVAKKNGF